MEDSKIYLQQKRQFYKLFIYNILCLTTYSPSSINQFQNNKPPNL